MAPTLSGVTEKRKWAEHHLKLIESSIRDFLASDPYPVLTDSYPECGVYHALLIGPKTLPAREIALMIGDCVHNMRSALDYIAWELAGASLADTETMFPIYETDIRFRKHGLRRIKNVQPKDARTLIERLQPYNTRYGGHLLVLSAINKLDATDKHKLLTVAVAIAEGATANQAIPRHVKAKAITRIDLFPNVRFIDGAKIATFAVNPPVPEMEVDFKIPFKVEFGDIHGFPKHTLVVPALKKMLDSLDLVIKRFKPFFS